MKEWFLVLEKGVLFREVSSYLGCPYRGVPLYINVGEKGIVKLNTLITIIIELGLGVLYNVILCAAIHATIHATICDLLLLECMDTVS